MKNKKIINFSLLSEKRDLCEIQKLKKHEILFNLFSLGLLAMPQAWRGSAGCFVENQN